MDTLFDIDNAKRAYRDYGGSDSKESYILGDDYYMIKFADTKVEENSLAASTSNSAISEYVSSHIAESMGLSVHKTKLAVVDGEIAVACLDFVEPNHKLQELNWFMRTVYRKQELGRIPSYDQLYGTINQSDLSSIASEAIMHYFYNFVLDAYIGNFDRHSGNLGFIRNLLTGELTTSPIYDCGSSLYPGLSETKFTDILSNKEEVLKRVNDFPKSALNKDNNFKQLNKYGYFEMLSSGMDANCTRAFLELYPRIDESKVNSIIDNTPLISDLRKTFYKQMLHYRKELILDRAYQVLQRRQEVINEDFTLLATSNPVHTSNIFVSKSN